MSPVLGARQAVLTAPDGVEVESAVTFMEALMAERIRAHEKHGPKSMEQSELLEHRRSSILVEEAVECMRALNDNEHGAIDLHDGQLYSDAPANCDVLDREQIQTAAMAYAWWVNRRGHRLKPIEPKPKVPPDLVMLLVELADKGGPLQSNLGDDSIANRARKLLDWLGVK